MLNCEEINRLQELVAKPLDKLNMLFLMNDLHEQDMRLISEISLLSMEISAIFKENNFTFLAEIFESIDKIINTTMFGNISYNIAMSYVLNIHELLEPALEYFFADGSIPETTKKSLTFLKNLILNNRPDSDDCHISSQDSEILPPLSLLKTNIQYAHIPDLPENIDELDGTFQYLEEHFEEISPIIDDFYVEAAELLHQTEEGLLVLENEPDNFEIINALFRYIHSLKRKFHLEKQSKNAPNRINNALTSIFIPYFCSE